MRQPNRTSIFTFVLALLIAATAWSGLSNGLAALRQAAELERATSDNVPWNLAQLEIEYLRFADALDAYLLPDPTDVSEQGEGEAALARLREVRLRFDILFSRISTIQQSPLFTEIRENENLKPKLFALAEFATETATELDSLPPTSLADLSALDARTEAQRRNIRRIALAGVTVIAELAAQRRLDLSESLWQMALASLASSLLLLFSIFRIWQAQRDTRFAATTMEGVARRLQAIISTSPIPIVIADQDMRIVEFNKASERVFGYTRREALSGDVGTLLVPEELRARHREGLRRYKRTGEKHIIGQSGVKISALRKDATVFPAEIELSEGSDQSGRFFVAYIRDVTSQEAHEKELREARDAALAGAKAKERVLTTVSHEMRTPLQGIMGALELLRSRTLTDAQEQYLDILERSSLHLLRHIEDLLAVARSGRKGIDIEYRSVDVRELVGDVRRDHLALAAESGNEIVVANWARDQPNFVCDPMRLRQVLDNLVSNALKFTCNGRVELGCCRDERDEMIEFWVADNGIGIANDELPHIFDDFYTTKSPNTRAFDGTGLGLGIAARVVGALGGRIWVESRVGRGSTFRFQVPLAPKADIDSATGDDPILKPTPETGPALLGDELRILLAEDNEISRKIVSETLRNAGFDVTAVADGEDGLKKLGQSNFDLIFLDISMPRMDGLEALRHIRSRAGPNAKVPVIALTAHVLEEDQKRFAEAGFDAVLGKPTSRAQLLAVIRRLVKQAGSTRHNEFDGSFFDEMVETLGLPMAREMVDKFETDVNASLDSLEQTLKEDGTNDAFARLAHQLCGLSAMFGAYDLEQVFRKLEAENGESGSGRDDERVATLIRKARDQASRVLSMLKDEVANKRSG
ncbi:hybrid sensor histidine kinase/response regulator [Sinisalibacter lacisalsi]|uniref:histidine kinase n=1 Tax=Sinisalibacter lacisalsi TaxID=1526570 RepID=A0ABQ1QH87_9RHOB|nr:ATP-binding protein [Sinisalibacter lacisalsi]GGD24911.1 hybrid sensor histidine kinase/response regulator [Sinisalibacter lacisalsi]